MRFSESCVTQEEGKWKHSREGKWKYPKMENESIKKRESENIQKMESESNYSDRWKVKVNRKWKVKVSTREEVKGWICFSVARIVYLSHPAAVDDANVLISYSPVKNAAWMFRRWEYRQFWDDLFKVFMKPQNEHLATVFNCCWIASILLNKACNGVMVSIKHGVKTCNCVIRDILGGDQTFLLFYASYIWHLTRI